MFIACKTKCMHANVIRVYMGLQNVSKIQQTTCKNHKCKHLDYETTNMCAHERSKTTPTSSESVHDVRPAPTSSAPMRTKD